MGSKGSSRYGLLIGGIPTTILALIVLAIAFVRVAAGSDSSSAENVLISTKNNGARIKLQTAEHRVRDLISKLDSVSDHAAKAKNEIHSTLRELWQIVDLLGKDRCGDVVERVRIAQRKAENRVMEQSNEIRQHLMTIETSKRELAEQGDSVSSLTAELKQERFQRQKFQTEVRELQAKLTRATAAESRDETFKQVSERLQNLVSVVSERAQILSRILNMVSQTQSGYESWRKEIDDISEVVRSAERDFSKDVGGESVEPHLRKIADLEGRLRDALKAQTSASKERVSLQDAIKKLEVQLAASAPASEKSQQRERIFVRTEEDRSWVGLVTLCFISLCTGAVGVFFLNAWQNGKPRSEALGQGNFGYTPTPTPAPTLNRQSPSFHHSKNSPMHFTVAGESGNKGGGPTSRGGTPRAY